MTNLIRNAGFVLIAAALFACGGDDDDSTGAGGTGATAGSAGSAGSTAGTAGTGGSGATAGTGGSNGGTGGSTAGTGGGGTGGGGTGGGGTGGGGTGGGGTGGGGTGGGGTGGSAGTGAVAGTGGSGGDPCAGVVGNGPDGCWLCAEFTDGCFDPATLCVDEAPLYAAAAGCACEGPCASVCNTPGNFCETGDALNASEECQACVFAPGDMGCGDQLAVCQAGATPTCDPMLTCAGALDPAGDPAMLCDGPEKDLYSAVYACGVANCANDCAPGGDPMACQVCMGTNCGAELQACTVGAMNGPVEYDETATFPTLDCSAPAQAPSNGSCVFIDNAAYLCNPVTNEGCDGAAGQACDFNFDNANPGFQCYDPPNDAMLCDTCGANDGFCGGGLTCVSTGMATGCAKYCCDDADCTSGQVCSHALYGASAPGVCAAP